MLFIKIQTKRTFLVQKLNQNKKKISRVNMIVLILKRKDLFLPVITLTIQKVKQKTENFRFVSIAKLLLMRKVGILLIISINNIHIFDFAKF